ncbi:MAG: hypothetical protein CMO12_04145 [Thaumarchaeota archaeon]|nr:hypothetical protein [Nitrososphaerota archaeon]
MTSLITGGTGFLGASLAREMTSKGEKPVLLDIAPNTRIIADVGDQVQLVRGDLSVLADVINVVRDYEIDEIIHLGGVISAAAEERPLGVFGVNFNGTLNVLEAARLFDVKKVIYSSSMAAYTTEGAPKRVREDWLRDPPTSYGISKVFSELWGLYYSRRYGLDFGALRFPTLIGPGRPWSTFAYASWIIQKAALNESWEIPVPPEARSPICYVKDGVLAIDALRRIHNPLSRIYNVGSISPSAQEILDEVKKSVPGAPLIFKPNEKVTKVIMSRTPPDLDDSLARQELNYSQNYQLATLVTDFLKEIAEHRAIYT